MEKIGLLVAIGFAILFSGCVPTYDIEPKYDTHKKTLNVSGKVIENVSLSINKNISNDTSFRFKEKIKKYVSTDNLCPDIKYLSQSAGTRAYIWGNLEDHLKEKYTMKNDGECIIEKISNVRFFNCRTTSGRYSTFYALETRESNSYGYSNLKAIFLKRRCFFSILSHFKSMALKDNVQVEKYRYKTEKNIKTSSTNGSSYTGEFAYGGINKECIKTGKIRINIKDNKVIGSVSVGKKNIDIKGILDNRNINGNIKNGTFSGRIQKNMKTITGNYFLKPCYGNFTLRLDNK